MAERMIKRTSKKPMLVVTGDNLQTLAAVAKVINESGLEAKVFLEYEVCEVGGNSNEIKHEDVYNR